MTAALMKWPRMMIRTRSPRLPICSRRGQSVQRSSRMRSSRSLRRISRGQHGQNSRRRLRQPGGKKSSRSVSPLHRKLQGARSRCSQSGSQMNSPQASLLSSQPVSRLDRQMNSQPVSPVNSRLRRRRLPHRRIIQRCCSGRQRTLCGRRRLSHRHLLRTVTVRSLLQISCQGRLMKAFITMRKI